MAFRPNPSNLSPLAPPFFSPAFDPPDRDASWMEPSGYRFGSSGSYGAPQGGASSQEFYPYENVWGESHVAPFERTAQFKSDSIEWLDDKSSMTAPESAAYHIKSAANHIKSSRASTVYASEHNTSFLRSHEPLASEICFTSAYDSAIINPGLSGKQQMGFYQSSKPSSAACGAFSPAINGASTSIDRSLPKSNSHIHLNDGNIENYRFPSTVRLSAPVNRPKVEIKQCSTDKRRKGKDVVNIDGLCDIPEKENSVLHKSIANHKLDGESFGSSLLSKHDVTNENSSARVSAETGVSRSSSDSMDQLSSGVDSPCWKGAPRYSPFGVDGAQKPKSTDSKTPVGTVIGGEKTQNFSAGLEKEIEILLPEGPKTGLSSAVCNLKLATEAGSGCSHVEPKSENDNTHEFSSKSSSEVALGNTLSLSNREAAPNTSIPEVADSENIEKSFKCPNGCRLGGEGAHFLVSTVYTLSKYLSSYYYDANILKSEDREVLLMAIGNLNACVSKTGLEGRRFESLAKSLPFDEKQSEACKVSFYQEFEKSRKKAFSVQDENPETNIYKELWFEAETALRTAKYELHHAKMMLNVKSNDHQSSTPESVNLQDAKRRSVLERSGTSALNFVFECGGDGTNLSSRTCNLGKDGIHNLYETPKGGELSHVGSKLGDADSSVMSRFKVLKDRMDKVDSRPHDRQCQPHGVGTTGGLNAETSALRTPCVSSEVDIGSQLQPELGAAYLSNPHQHSIELASPSIPSSTAWRQNLPEFQATSASNFWRRDSLEFQTPGTSANNIWRHGSQEVNSPATSSSNPWIRESQQLPIAATSASSPWLCLSNELRNPGIPASNSGLHAPHQLFNDSPEINYGSGMQHIGACHKEVMLDEDYLRGNYNGVIGPQTSNLSQVYVDIPVAATNRSSHPPYASSDGEFRNYFSGRRYNTSDWEHVEREELRL